MRIGLHAAFFAEGAGGGIERCVRELVAAFGRVAGEHEFVLFTGRGNAGTFPLPSNFSERALPVRPENRLQKVFCDQVLAPLAARKARVDVLFSPGNIGPVFGFAPRAAMIHDAAPWMRPSPFSFFQALALRFFFIATARASDAVIAPSSFSRAEIARRTGIGPDRIALVPEAGDHLEGGPGAGLPPLILCVASRAAHKNAEGLLAAYAILRERRGLRLPLVLLGAAPRPGRPGVIFRDGVSDALLAALYASAAVTVVPSFYEGFGLAAAEAMCAGSPVAAARAGALPETLGPAAVFFDPRDPRDMARAVAEILDDPALAARLSRAGRSRSLALTWDACARGVMEVLAGAAGKDARRRGRMR